MLPTLRRTVALLALLAPLAGSVGAAVLADDLTAVQKLMQTGQTAQAMTRVDRLLVDTPRHPQLRFMKGVMLADAQRRSEAIEVFRLLSLDYPELPEPYNNRAVIHAALGEFEQAREQLEAALRAQPNYAVAHQNLGDVYLQLSRRAYAAALELDPGNAQIAPKLALLRELTQSQASAAAAAAAASAARIAR